MQKFVNDLGFGSSLPSLPIDVDNSEVVSAASAAATADDDDLEFKRETNRIQRQLSHELYRLDEHEEEDKEAMPEQETQSRNTHQPTADLNATATASSTTATAAAVHRTGNKPKPIWKGKTLRSLLFTHALVVSMAISRIACICVGARVPV
jgi:hypothetical protein